MYTQEIINNIKEEIIKVDQMNKEYDKLKNSIKDPKLSIVADYFKGNR